MLNFFPVRNRLALYSLFLFELKFCLSWFVLEIRKKDGEPHPSNTLYQIICSLWCNLRETGRADVNLFTNPAFHGFHSTLDGEIKCLNATGNNVSKWQAQPITVEQENRLWEMGFLGDYNVNVLLKTLVFQVVFSLHQEVRMNTGGHSLFQSCMNLLVSMHIWCIVRMCWN